MTIPLQLDEAYQEAIKKDSEPSICIAGSQFRGDYESCMYCVTQLKATPVEMKIFLPYFEYCASSNSTSPGEKAYASSQVHITTLAVGPTSTVMALSAQVPATTTETGTTMGKCATP